MASHPNPITRAGAAFCGNTVPSAPVSRGRGGSSANGVPSVTERVLELAARACGTNTPELGEHGIGKSAASGTLANLVASRRLFRVNGEVQPQGVVVHQFFTSQHAADAWARIAPMYRPNMRLRRKSRSSTSGAPQRSHHKLKRRDPGVVPVTFRSAAVPWHDPRYHVPETHRGVFSALGPGRYSDEAATCAARAVGVR